MKLEIGISAKKVKGFTLIELMIVITMVIISLSFILVKIDFHYNARVKFDNEGEVLLSKIKLATQEAILKHTLIRLIVESNGYSFQILTRMDELGTWQVFEKNSRFSNVKLPYDIELKAEHPWVEISPTGDFGPFTITLSDTSRNRKCQIVGVQSNMRLIKNA